MCLWSHVSVPKIMSAGATDSVALNVGILFLRDWKLITRFVIGVLFRPCGKEAVLSGEWLWGQGGFGGGVVLQGGGVSLGGCAGVLEF